MRKHSTCSVIIHFILEMTVLYALYKLYVYLRVRFALALGLRSLTAPLEEVRASRGTDDGGNSK
jgi:hypothetical protein